MKKRKGKKGVKEENECRLVFGFGGKGVVARGHSRVRSWVLLVLLVFSVFVHFCYRELGFVLVYRI